MKKQLLSVLLLAGGLVAGSLTTAQAQTPVFVRWPFTVSASDSAVLRSANTTVGAPTLRRLVLADGSTSVTVGSATLNVKPYSSAFGMAFAPAAVGSNWSTSASPAGPGGTVKRGIYTQVSVTAAATATAGLRADSLILNTGFIGTASGTTMAVVYSKSGFTTADSTDVTGNKGPAGTAATGGFANPVALPQIAALPNTNVYRIALNGSTGVTLTAGQTLTIRIYPSCSSTGASGRYGSIRNLILKSTQAVLASRSAVATDLNVYPNPTQGRLLVPHAPAGTGAQLLVYSATGARVLAQPVAAGSLETTVELNDLAKGLYLVEYADGSQRRTTRVAKD